MEYLIQLLLLFVVINCALKLTFWKTWQVLLFSAVCAGFVILYYPYAITQSKTQLDSYLDDVGIMQDIAVLVTFESVLCFAFCFAALRALYGRRAKRWVKPLYWYPGILIFPALSYLLLYMIFNMAGTSFSAIAYSLAAGIFVLLPSLSLGMKYLLPEKELRLEVHFLASLFVSIIGLISTVNGNVTYQASEESLNIKVFLVSLALFAAFFVIGFLFNRYKWRFRKMKQSSN